MSFFSMRILLLMISLGFSVQVNAQELSDFSSDILGSEPLNEVPLWHVPAEMTLEEYEDANRRLSVGLMLMAIPVPGALQFYANEPRSGWKHVGTFALGLTSILIGAANIEQEDAWDKSDYEVVDIVGESGKVKRYEKIPINLKGEIYDYNLRELERADREGGGGLFVLLGIGMVAGSYLNSWIDGIKTIERKRNAVRYRYGKKLDFSFQIQPTIDMQKEKFGGQLCLRF